MNNKHQSFSYKLIPFTNILLPDPKNFIDYKNENPKIGNTISCDKIVYNIKDMDKDSWFLNIEQKYVENAKKIINYFKRKKIGIVIKEKKEEKNVHKDLFNYGYDIKLINNSYIEKEYNNISESNTDIPEIIVKKYKDGDKILLYNDCTKNRSGGTEALLLVRENRIICSPIIKETIKEIWYRGD